MWCGDRTCWRTCRVGRQMIKTTFRHINGGLHYLSKLGDGSFPCAIPGISKVAALIGRTLLALFFRCGLWLCSAWLCSTWFCGSVRRGSVRRGSVQRTKSKSLRPGGGTSTCGATERLPGVTVGHSGGSCDRGASGMTSTCGADTGRRVQLWDFHWWG